MQLQHQLEMEEQNRRDREQSLRDEDLAAWIEDRDETESILRIMRRSGDIVAKPVAKEIASFSPLTSQVKEINFALKDPSMANHAEEAKAKRVKKKEDVFTVDLGMAKQAVLVRGHGIGSRGALALAAELSTGVGMI